MAEKPNKDDVDDDKGLAQTDDDGKKLAEGGEEASLAMRKPSEDADLDEREDISETEREAIREHRRQERREAKARRREAIGRKDRTIAQLERQNAEMAARVEALEGRTTGGDLARLDSAIENAATEVELASSAMAEAMKAQDTSIFAEAQNIWYAARRKQEELAGYKQRIIAHQRRGASERGQPVAPDTRVVENATAWARKNQWYDPRGRDEDSEFVRVIDRRMHSEGWDPGTKEYWEELDERVRKRLPHRYKANGKRESEDDDFEDDEPEPASRRQITGGAGGDSPGGRSNGTSRTLTPARVAALKEAGKWDDPKARARAIKYYENYDRQHNSRS